MSEEAKQPTFPDAATAVSWAEEVLDKQGARSQLGKLMKRGFGELTEDEARDFAHTIVMIVAGHPHQSKAAAFSYIYGREDHHRESLLVEELTRMMVDHLLAKDGNKLKPADTLRDLALATIRSQRDMYLFNRHHPMARIARFMRMSPNTFKDKASLWPELYGMTRTAFRRLVDDGDKALDELLRDRGFVV